MKALDTDIIVRFLINDDKARANRIRQMFRQAERDKEIFFVPVPVVLEMIRVLESVYRVERDDIIDAIETLMLMPIFKLDALAGIQAFLSAARTISADLSDLLIGHCALASGCESVVSFNKKA